MLSASKSYAERLFRYVRIDRLDPARRPSAPCSPRPTEDVDFEPRTRSTALGATSDGYPYFVQAYGKAAWDHAPG